MTPHTTLKLTSPVTIADETINEIVMREPTGEDLELIGTPIEIDPVAAAGGGNPIKFHDKIIPAMISRLANVPPAVVRKMSARDIQSAKWLLVPFFVPDMSALSSLAMSLPSGTGKTRTRS